MIETINDARTAARRVTLPRSPIPLTVEIEGSSWVGRPKQDTIVIELRAEVRDRDTGAPSRLNFHRMARLPLTEEHFFVEVRRTVVELFTHEALECLLVDGERRFDPHKDGP